MAAASLFGYLKLAYLSQPKSERKLYQTIRKLRPGRIVEVGVQQAIRSERMIRVAQRYQPNGVHYCGIDLFEAREPQQPGTTLKQAHVMLKSTGAQVKLVPGDPFSALARSSNALTETDLLLISADQDRESLERAWFYIPRMLHQASVVLEEQWDPNAEQTRWTAIDAAAVSGQHDSQRRAA